MTRAQDLLQNVRRVIPVPVIDRLAARRARRMMRHPGYREQQEAEMRFLLGNAVRAGEIPELAERYAEQAIRRAYLRWHPRAVTRQAVVGVGHLTQRDPDRPMIVSFMHHDHYEGMFASLSRHGVRCHLLVLAEALAPEAPAALKQNMKIMALGSTLIPTGGGLKQLLERLVPGMVLAIACDVPGQTDVSFLGRRVRGSSGAARLAMMTGSPVCVVTSWRDDSGATYLRAATPLEPADFEDADQLLAEMLRQHGEAVLAWPEAFETPLARFGSLESEHVTPTLVRHARPA